MQNPFQFIAPWWLRRRIAGLDAGDVCAVCSGEGGYKVVKVLAVDHSAIHVRLYKNRFTNRPQSVDTRELSLGSIDDPDGFGVGHLPLSRSTFAGWVPIRICRETLVDEELEGHQIWRESQGGTWGLQ